MKKRAFLLIEILIAFVLIEICLLPLVKQPLYLYRAEMVQLEKMELERLADWSFTEVKEILLKNEIPWDKIPERWTTTAPFPLRAATISIPGNKEKKVERSFTLYGNGERLGRDDAIYRSLEVCIVLNEDTFKFRLLVQKQAIN